MDDPIRDGWVDVDQGRIGGVGRGDAGGAINLGRVAILLIFALAFPALPLVVSYLFHLLRIRAENPSPIKEATYECGVEAEGTSWGQFHARYYLFALGFVIFDVDVIFLYPWAVAFDQLALFGLIEMVLFIVAVLVVYAYVWRRRGLEWD